MEYDLREKGATPARRAIGTIPSLLFLFNFFMSLTFRFMCLVRRLEYDVLFSDLSLLGDGWPGRLTASLSNENNRIASTSQKDASPSPQSRSFATRDVEVQYSTYHTWSTYMSQSPAILHLTLPRELISRLCSIESDSCSGSWRKLYQTKPLADCLPEMS